MSRLVLVSLAVCLLLVSFNGCLGQEVRSRPNSVRTGKSHRLRGRQGECQLDRLNALEPNIKIECEAGLIEAWDNKKDEFQCAGVALVRHTIEPNGLLLPSFNNAPQLIYIVEGVGIQGAVIPGCPETYQSSQQSGRFQDQHQKIRRFRQGDILALPAGVAHWIYNDGNRPLVAVVLLDVSNAANQLDLNPRRFFLAGDPEDPQQQEQRQPRHPSPSRGEGQGEGEGEGEGEGRGEGQGQGQGRGERQGEGEGKGRGEGQGQDRGEGQGEGQQQGSCNNIFCGFRASILAEVFNVDEKTVRKLQSQNDNRGYIVNVQGGLHVLRPPSVRGYEEHEEERERYQYDEKRTREGRSNGLEETLCSLRLRENIGSPLRADIYTRQAGHIATLNSYNLPILHWLQLSAEKGLLHNNAIMVPHYNMNSHSILYVIRGRARVQIVNDNGETVLDEELRKGQVVVVPQNYAVVKRAESEGFEWISFKTSDNAMITPLAGRTSYLRALPDEVVANAYQISREEARELKYSRTEAIIFRSPGREGRSPRFESRRRAAA